MSLSFVIFGAKSTGKTCYLRSLSGKEGKIGKGDQKTREYISVLETIDTPDATSAGFEELSFNYSGKLDLKNIDFTLNEFDGKFAQDHKEFENNKDLLQYVETSKGVIFFIPYYTDKELKAKNKEIRDTANTIDALLRLLQTQDKEYSEIKKPAIIAVTMWDKKKNAEYSVDNKEAIDYLLSNEQLKKSYKAVENRFERLKVVPISSKEDKNTSTLIEILIKDVFCVWEKHIETLEKKLKQNASRENKKELQGYLKDRLDDIKSYKDGIYQKRYDVLTQDIDQQNTLFFKKVLKWSIPVIILFLIIQIFVNDNKEIRLYEKIISEYNKKNYYQLENNIDIYLKKYEKNDMDHYKKIVEIQSAYPMECKKSIETKMKKLDNIKSIQKYDDQIGKVYSASKNCGLDDFQNNIKTRYLDVNDLYDEYKHSLAILDELNLDILNEEALISVIQTIGKLSGYEEEKRLRDKLIVVIERIGTSNNEEAITTILSKTSSLKLSDNLMQKLSKKLNSLHIEQTYVDLLNDIQNGVFLDIVKQIDAVSNLNFTLDQKNHLITLLDKKFNITVEEVLKNEMPNTIHTIDDFNRLKKAIEDIKMDSENGVIKNIGHVPKMNAENKNVLNKQKIVLQTVQNILTVGVRPKHIVFKAYNENNILNFSCTGIDSKDDLQLTIGKYYYDDDGATCIGTSMTYLNQHFYTPGNYYGTATESDILFNDNANFSFRLSDNDIIMMMNDRSVKKNIKNNFTITFEP